MEFQDSQNRSTFFGMLTYYFHIIIDFITSILKSFMPAQEIMLNSRRLTIIKQLGEGGYSFVYLVRDRSTGELFALKKVRCELPDQIKLLKQEIEAHGKVNSEYVMKLVDSKVDVGLKTFGYLLLPYFELGTVQDLISNNPRGIPMDRICSIGIDICNGLSVFHACDPPLAFRDLKPANVLLTSPKNAILMDLGSVSPGRVAVETRSDSIALGEYCAQTVTAPYRAPELFEPPTKTIITEKCDIW